MTSISSRFDIYRFEFIQCQTDTNSAGMGAVVYSGGAFDTVNYANEGYVTSSGGGTGVGTGSTYLPICTTNGLYVDGVYNRPLSGWAELYNPLGPFGKHWIAETYYEEYSTAYYYCTWNGGYFSGGPVTGIKFYWGGGGFHSGVIKVYGI
jgi:hypothetical protein